MYIVHIKQILKSTEIPTHMTRIMIKQRDLREETLNTQQNYYNCLSRN